MHRRHNNAERQDESSQGREPRGQRWLGWTLLMRPPAPLGSPRLQGAFMSVYPMHRLELLQRGQLPRPSSPKCGLTAPSGREASPSLHPLPSSGGSAEGTGQEPQSCTSSLSSATNLLVASAGPSLSMSSGFSQNGGWECTHMHLPLWAESAPGQMSPGLSEALEIRKFYRNQLLE